jgi:ABC-type sugar transport system permease subunit
MIGYGSTIAVTVFMISLVLALAYLRALKSERLQGAAAR